MGIKTYQEKNTKPMKKTRAQSGLPVRRKIQKTTQEFGLKKSDIVQTLVGPFMFQNKPNILNKLLMLYQNLFYMYFCICISVKFNKVSMPTRA